MPQHCQPHDHSTIESRREVTSEARSLQALADLIAAGWRTVPTGHGNVLLFVLLWNEGSSDSLTVKGPEDVFAERVNAYGQPVWRDQGAAIDVITRITELPPPGTPGAPVQILRPMDNGVH